jgi:hypothetical protein
MKTHRSRRSSGLPRSADSQAWVNEMRGRASEFRRIIEKGWRVVESHNLEDWERKTGVDSRDIQTTLDGMLQTDLKSFETKYHQWIDSICDKTVYDENTTVLLDSGVDLLKSKTTYRINTWWEIEIIHPDRATAYQEKRLFSKASKSLSESTSCTSFSDLGNVPEEVESEDEDDTCTKANKVV